MGDGATAGPSSLPELSDIIPMVVKRSSGDREIAGPSAPLMKLLYPFKRKAQVPRGPQASLGYDILDARYNSLKYKRRYLSIIYYQIARLGYFSPNEVQKSIDWLAANPNDTTTSYILAATLAAFDPAEPHPFTGNVRKNLATDKGTIVREVENRVEAFVRQELVPASKPDASLASRIFNEIESIGTTVTQAQIARQNAQSNTIPPSGPGSQPSLSYDILDARYDSLKYERRYKSRSIGSRPIQMTPRRLTSSALAATLTAFYSAEPHSFPGKVRKNLATDKGAIAYMKRQLTPNTHRQAPPPPRSPQPRSRNRGTTSGLPFREKYDCSPFVHDIAGIYPSHMVIDSSIPSVSARRNSLRIIAPTTIWKEPGLKATILLKWTLFMAETRHCDPTLENQQGFKTE
ncbi:hypothetical protein EV363DRAFT_1541594 [Boletus edulis]|nr:hypothetical protein EV363DRAFT_1541594 [Boletus edulis]